MAMVTGDAAEKASLGDRNGDEVKGGEQVNSNLSPHVTGDWLDWQ
jgi:hypothetical protein